MPLVEVATVRLLPALSSNIPNSFDATWTHACDLATKAAGGVSFQLYHAVSPTDKDVYYLIGGWQSSEDHIGFLSTPDAVILAKSIGQHMTVDIVRHIDGDIGTLSDTGGRPKKLRVAVYKVPAAGVVDWPSQWKSSEHAGGSGGWDLSSEVQKQHAAFRKMGEATNSVSAFGGSDVGGNRSWIWIDDATKAAGAMLGPGNIEPEVFEIEYVLG